MSNAVEFEVLRAAYAARRHDIADKLELAARHYIAENDQADALHTLAMLQDAVRELAIELRGGDDTVPHFAKLKSIPVVAGKTIAQSYGYDQVIIIARRCHDSAEPHGEHVTTYGRTKEHCAVAADIGDFLKFKVMGWASSSEVDDGTQ